MDDEIKQWREELKSQRKETNAIADYDVIPLHGKSKIFDTFIDNMDRSIPNKVTRFLHISQ